MVTDEYMICNDQVKCLLHLIKTKYRCLSIPGDSIVLKICSENVLWPRNLKSAFNNDKIIHLVMYWFRSIKSGKGVDFTSKCNNIVLTPNISKAWPFSVCYGGHWVFIKVHIVHEVMLALHKHAEWSGSLWLWTCNTNLLILKPKYAHSEWSHT